MKKKIPQQRKGINPAMVYMSEEAKAKTAIRAASEAVKLVTLKILHDTFDFGEKRQQRFMEEFSKQMEAYEQGYFNYQDLKDLVENGLKDRNKGPKKKEGRSNCPG